MNLDSFIERRQKSAACLRGNAEQVAEILDASVLLGQVKKLRGGKYAV